MPCLQQGAKLWPEQQTSIARAVVDYCEAIDAVKAKRLSMGLALLVVSPLVVGWSSSALGPVGNPTKGP